ncbi:MAG: Fe-S cluster assembly ATPase SufC [Alphaproteobacteria bacterium]|nr:Fe-S cluster assembly ATPase SufC [Alphaproteobacteria bacterium]MDD9919119.1 Fe-S cluster assembly ATPase SufC [Alphaproteobacteria bacterium]
MLKIENLQAKVAEDAGDKTILNGINLTVQAGEVHAIMGPNGAGKSTLAHVLSGKPGYEATNGTATLDGQNLLDMEEPDERAHSGLFLAFQYPVELPGVNAAQFLRTALNAHRTARGEEELNGADFLRLARAKMADLKMDDAFLKRAVNSGFSGGEKKRFEILQMALLEPKLAVLDETDSGLDIDALKIVANGVNAMRQDDRGFIVITHYQRLLDYIQPDYVHILANGKIVKSGGAELAKQLEAEGYDKVMAA